MTESLSSRVQLMLKNTCGHTKYWLSSSLELYKLFFCLIDSIPIYVFTWFSKSLHLFPGFPAMYKRWWVAQEFCVCECAGLLFAATHTLSKWGIIIFLPKSNILHIWYFVSLCYLWTNNMEGLLSVYTGNLQWLCSRHMAQQPARLRTQVKYPLHSSSFSFSLISIKCYMLMLKTFWPKASLLTYSDINEWMRQINNKYKI